MNKPRTSLRRGVACRVPDVVGAALLRVSLVCETVFCHSAKSDSVHNHTVQLASVREHEGVVTAVDIGLVSRRLFAQTGR